MNYRASTAHFVTPWRSRRRGLTAETRAETVRCPRICIPATAVSLASGPGVRRGLPDGRALAAAAQVARAQKDAAAWNARARIRHRAEGRLVALDDYSGSALFVLDQVGAGRIPLYGSCVCRRPGWHLADEVRVRDGEGRLGISLVLAYLPLGSHRPGRPRRRPMEGACAQAYRGDHLVLVVGALSPDWMSTGLQLPLLVAGLALVFLRTRLAWPEIEAGNPGSRRQGEEIWLADGPTVRPAPILGRFLKFHGEVSEYLGCYAYGAALGRRSRGARFMA